MLVTDEMAPEDIALIFLSDTIAGNSPVLMGVECKNARAFRFGCALKNHRSGVPEQEES